MDLASALVARYAPNSVFLADWPAVAAAPSIEVAVPAAFWAFWPGLSDGTNDGGVGGAVGAAGAGGSGGAGAGGGTAGTAGAAAGAPPPPPPPKTLEKNLGTKLIAVSHIRHIRAQATCGLRRK
jgi:hypothetical protein